MQSIICFGQLGPTCDMQFVMTIFCSSVLTVTKTKGKFVVRSFEGGVMFPYKTVKVCSLTSSGLMGGNAHHHQGGGHCKQMIRVLAITFDLRDLLTLQFECNKSSLS